jgi:hypothetical protein
MTGRVLALDSAQNWWRHEFAELGLLGGGAIVLWSIVAGWRLLVARVSPDGLVAATTLRALLIGMIVASFVQVPTQNPVVLLWFFVAVAWLAALTGLADRIEPTSQRTHRIAWWAVVACAVLYASAHLILAAGPLGVDARARRAHREYITGTYGFEAIPDAGGYRWTGQSAHMLLQPETDTLPMRIWAAHPDIETRPVRIRFSTPCGTFFTTSLYSRHPLDLLVHLPPGLHQLDLDIDVSRTWQPSAYGSPDRRRLGIAVETQFGRKSMPPIEVRGAEVPSCNDSQ